MHIKVNTISVQRHKNGQTTISGLTDGDLRLIAQCVEEGSFTGGDRGGDVSRAALRFASALRQPTRYGTIGSCTILGNGASAAELYEEPVNLLGRVTT